MDVLTKYALDIYNDYRLLRRLKWLRNSILIIVALAWMAIFAIHAWHPLLWDKLLKEPPWTSAWGFLIIFTTALCYWTVTIQQRIINTAKNHKGEESDDQR